LGVPLDLAHRFYFSLSALLNAEKAFQAAGFTLQYFADYCKRIFVAILNAALLSNLRSNLNTNTLF